MAGINIQELVKDFSHKDGNLRVIDHLNYIFDEQKITVILGRSGCGKTTLLRIIQELEEPSAGFVDTHGLKIGIVFQEPRLMPWLDVYKNVALGSEHEDMVDELIRFVGLEKFTHSFPHQLSGGMQSRVSLIRAFAYNADYILMDEPFAALDYFTRSSLQQELLKLFKRKRFGVIFVTHSIDEALLLGNDILIMDKGKIKSSYKIQKDERNLLDDEFIEMKRSIIKDLK